MKSCNDEKNCNKKFNRKGNKMKKRIYVKSNLAVLVVFTACQFLVLLYRPYLKSTWSKSEF